LDPASGKKKAQGVSPKRELDIQAPNPGWAEQDPEIWITHIKNALNEVKDQLGDGLSSVTAIGISYQMHGLVLIDASGKVIRPSIIWCDGRAVPYGNRAFSDLGKEFCLPALLNSPGNFTAAKLAWVKENEPDNFKKIHKIMLPGDYAAFRLTGEPVITPSGLSEGILWNFKENSTAQALMDYFGFQDSLLPRIRPVFSEQGTVTQSAADEFGLPRGIPVAYRAGDQPNNAFSLNVMNPGELAATAGTSGVVYGIIDTPSYDQKSRVNTFVHVNHTPDNPRYGVLLCLNGTGILNRWIKTNCSGDSIDYGDINNAAAEAPVGSDGLVILPYGNGAERTLENQDPGASVHGLNFNVHNRKHLYRASQEGIVFALAYGIEIMQGMGLTVDTVKAGYANMFLSPLFSEAFSSVSGAIIRLYSTDGSEGAARGAGIGAKVFSGREEAFKGLEEREVIEPSETKAGLYREAYGRWKSVLNRQLNGYVVPPNVDMKTG
jgi:xylulokinase